LSGFYKKFHRPIEMVQYATQTGSFQPRNVGDGEVFGAELEFRFSLGELAEGLRNLSLSSNFTYTYSRIEMSQTEYESRLDNARTGQPIGRYRDMAGQAPYILNAGLAYNGGDKGFWKGLEAGFYYNVQGLTLQYVGIVDRPDIYSKPFHSLNFNANKSFGENKRLQLGLKIENLLNQEKESVFVSYEAADQYFQRLDPGIMVQLRVSYNLF
jgi:outer membrane receptor protein involved in Fe transport